VTIERVGGLPRSIGFLLLPGFSMLSLFGALEPLRSANRLLGYQHHGWRIYTPDGSPVQASCGMTVPADAMAAAESSQDDLSCLIVIAGFDPWPPPGRRLKNWLRALDRRGVVLGAVDTGAFLLASANLLENVRTVVHWESAEALLEMFPELSLSDNLYEIQGRRLLCAGGTAVLEMMIVLLEMTHGAALAAGVADRLMHVRVRDRTHRGFPASAGSATLSDPDVLRAIEFMEERIETVSSIYEVARLTGVSKRTLERKFRQLLDQTPTQTYLQLRLEHARQLLQNTDMKMQEVVLASGFASMSYFCRAYKKRFRRSPGSDRRLDYSRVESRAMLGSVNLAADVDTSQNAQE